MKPTGKCLLPRGFRFCGLTSWTRHVDDNMHNSVRDSKAKRAGRRYLKRVARAKGKAACNDTNEG